MNERLCILHDGRLDRTGKKLYMRHIRYCFESADDVLLCGRLLALDDKYSQAPLALHSPTAPFRCPRQ